MYAKNKRALMSDFRRCNNNKNAMTQRIVALRACVSLRHFACVRMNNKMDVFGSLVYSFFLSGSLQQVGTLKVYFVSQL